MPTIEPPPEVSSTKPYLVRAIYEWCSDNGFTPYIAVAVNHQTRVPIAHVRNGEIVLNVSALATHRLQLTNTEVSFTARFSGVAEEIWVPIEQVVAIYAKETGHGMAFDVPKPMAEDDTGSTDAPEPGLAAPISRAKKPSAGAGRSPSTRRPSVGLAPPAVLASSEKTKLSLQPDPSPDSEPGGPGPKTPGPKAAGSQGRPTLRRVK